MAAERISFVFFQEAVYKWSTEKYIEFCSRNGRSGVAWMKAGDWKLRGIRRGVEKGE
jgi:hypothetical protein